MGIKKRKESAMNLGFPAVNETPLIRKESQEEEQFGKESWAVAIRCLVCWRDLE